MNIQINIQEILETCKQAAYTAGQIILDVYNSDFEYELKDDNSPLTIADKKANDHIIKTISKYDLAILSEESKDNKSRLTKDYCFIVDPLDGTKEFINKNGEFTVNIALTYKGNPIIGVIYAPVLNILYYASEGNGAFMFDYNTNINKQIKVSNKTTDLIIVASKSHSSEKEKQLLEDNKQKITNFRSVGSSLKGCLIATGEADIYYRFGLTNEWDICAMHCIVSEAGGLLQQMTKEKMTYNREINLNEKGFFVVNTKENIFV